MATSMGLGALETYNACFKRKHRWILEIPEVSSVGINVLLHSKAARPSVQFKEIEALHVTETIYFPGRPDWKPINLTLYDTKVGDLRNIHPVFEWIKRIYDPQTGFWGYAVDNTINGNNGNVRGFKKPTCYLSLLDGCGKMIEGWKLEGVWCQNAEFGELDMQSSEVVTCDVSLRYDRAYWEAVRT